MPGLIITNGAIQGSYEAINTSSIALVAQNNIISGAEYGIYLCSGSMLAGCFSSTFRM